MKMMFTTGEVAKICHVKTSTITRWFDAGKLKGYRVPNSQHRRVKRDALLSFLDEYGLSADGVAEFDRKYKHGDS